MKCISNPTILLREVLQKGPTKPSPKPVAIWHIYKARCYTAPPKPVATWHLYKTCCYTVSLQSPLLHGTFIKPVATRHRYDAAPSKPATMRHLQSPLLHGIFTKPVATWHLYEARYDAATSKPATMRHL